MKDTVIKGDGTSQFIKAPASMPATYAEWRAQLLAGTATVDLSLNDDGVTAKGTALSKANLLSDETAEELTGTFGDDVTLDYALQFVSPKAKTENVTLTSDGWTGEGPYTQGVYIVYPLQSWTKGFIGIAQTATAEQREAARNALLSVTGQSGGALTITADGEKPTVSIPLTLTILG